MMNEERGREVGSYEMKNCRESRIFPRNMKLPDGWTDVLFSSERSVIISFSPSLEPRIERERERERIIASPSGRGLQLKLSLARSQGAGMAVSRWPG